MVAALAPDREFRGPGCDDRCTVLRALIPGVFGRSELMLHDASAHEEYGRQQVVERPPSIVVTGPLLVDLDRLDVFVGERLVRFTSTELKLLRSIALRAGGTVEVDTLLREVWGPEWVGPRPMDSAHVIRVNLSRIRDKLGEAGALITTIVGIGYRMEMVPPAGPLPFPSLVRLPISVWSRDHDCCKRCGETRSPHRARGCCNACVRRAARAGAPIGDDS
jgi:hypothetical protein